MRTLPLIAALACSLASAPTATSTLPPPSQHDPVEVLAPRTGLDDREMRCLTEAVYFESRGESSAGQRAVAEVVLNRVDHSMYPDTVCGVVYQARRGVCQFSWACNDNRTIRDQAAFRRAYRNAERAAHNVLTGDNLLVEGATHFHHRSVRPSWASKLVVVGRIGNHIFYSLPET